MLHHILSVGVSALTTRDEPSSPDAPTTTLQPLGLVLLGILLLVFVPVLVWASYSVRYVYTTVAIVEDPTPASYEAVLSDERDERDVPGTANADGAAATTAAANNKDGTAAGPSKPISSSIRSIRRTLRDAHGLKGDFRGVRLALLTAVLARVGAGIVGAIVPVLPAFVSGLLMSLVLVQFSTAWVHAVIRAPSLSSPRPSIFRGGLPPFRRTFEATAVPVVVAWLAQAATGGLTLLVSTALGLRTFDLKNPTANEVPVYTHAMLWKLLVVGAVVVALSVLLILPTDVLLVRVQASLLPPDEDTIVPFDRSFSGTVEPAVVVVEGGGGSGSSGRCYVTLRDALRTLSAASWRRIALVYVKAMLLLVGVVVMFGVLAVGIVVGLSKPE